MHAINTVRAPLLTNHVYASPAKAAWNVGKVLAPCFELTRYDPGMQCFKHKTLVVKTGRALSHVAQHKVFCITGPMGASFTSEQEALVKDTWAVLKKDAAHHGLALFLTVFDIAPAAKKLFPFLKDTDVPLEKNPKLKAHALQVFIVICEAASSLSKKGQVLTPGSTMKDMAHAHMISGVVDEHYDVVRYSLLKTVQAGIPPEMWNEEVKKAWGDAYDELVQAIKAQEEYAAAS